MKKYLIAFLTLLPVIVFSQNKVGINVDAPQARLDILSFGAGDTLLRFSTDRPWIFKQNSSGISSRLSLQSTVNDKWFDILSANGLNRALEILSNDSYTRLMLVPDSGEVGIGVNDAASKLHISANSSLNFAQLRLTEEGDDYARLKMENDVNPGVFWDIAGRADSVLENSRLNFFFSSPNGGGDRMTIRGNGKVGIGTTNPEANLDIIGGNWNLEGGSPGDLRIGNPTYNLRIGVATGGGGAGAARIFADGGINELTFGTDSSIRMTIKGNGNVGIGTTNPTEKLHVNGSFRIGDLSGSGDRNVIVDSNGKFKIGTTGVGDSDWIENASSVYNNSHNIGIGTSSPATKLHIINGDNPNGHLKLTVPNSGQFDLSGRTMTLGGDFINVTGLLNDHLFLQDASNGNILMVQGGGNVGVGTVSAPSAKLTVEGLDNDGVTGAFEVRSAGNGQRMIFDGNEIDVEGTSLALHLNANTMRPVTIGTLNIADGYMLSVDGKVIAEEMRVQLSSAWPDYVFNDSYELMTIEEVDESIKKNGHLPGIPSAGQIDSEGLNVGDMQKRMMEKIEELTLYVIALNKKNLELEKRIEKLLK